MPHTDAPDLSGLGSFIRVRRHTLGLTQSQLADRFGGPQERISVLEHGKYGTPSLPSLARLGDALETSLAELLEAAGYTVAVDAADEAAAEHQRGSDVRLHPGDRETVETSGLSALLTDDELSPLELALRCNGHDYHATIQAAGSESLLTLTDDEQGTMPFLSGHYLATQERAIVFALLEVLRFNRRRAPIPEAGC
jgi:transcriptional regulator with XRE-family HTH domain